MANVNSYGSIEGVAGLAPRWANSGGDFDETTRPTLENITRWLEGVTSMINMKLQELGFTTPITDDNVMPMLNLFVDEEVASMADGVNGSGKFGPTSMRKAKRGSRWNLIREDVNEFLEDVALGLERAGATREYSATEGIGYRDTDQSGDEIFPLTQRKGFGDWPFQTDWDDG